MSVVNQTAKSGVKERREAKAHEDHKEKNAHLNWMGGPSYTIGNPVFNLRLAASSCFFGEPQYYHRDEDDKRPNRRGCGLARPHALDARELKYLRDILNAIDPQEWRGMSPQEMMESAIDKALDCDAEATLREAVRLRNEENIRTTPQVIMVRAAHHPKVRGTGLVRKYAKDILTRADELAVQLAYQLGKYGRKAIPNSLKSKAWREAFARFSEYDLAKYRMESREVKTVDVMNLCHPKSDAVTKLAKGELKTTGETWEAIVSAKGSNEDAWREALSHMGHMALLRNIRNLLEKGIKPSEFIEKLVAGAEKGRQLPFRYYSAYQAVESAPGQVLDAIETCLETSLGNLPHFSGRVMSLVDNSGSAWGACESSMGTMHIAQIGNLTGAITARVSDEGYVGVFGDNLKTVPIRKKSSVFEITKNLDEIGQGIGGGTEHGIWLFWKQAIEKKEHWDSVFVYSDMQAGHGGLYGVGNEYPVWMKGYGGGHAYIDVPKLIIEYRNKVNPKVMVYLVQIAGYQDTIVPEFYDRTAVLGGWGDGLLRFAAEMGSIWEAKQ